MILDLPWGKDGRIPLEIPDRNVLAVVGPKTMECGDEAACLKRAIASPAGGPPLREFVSGGRDVLFIVNDATRPTPTARVLDVIEREVPGLEPRYLVATGMHRAPTDCEYEQIFGAARLARDRGAIFAHDAKSAAEMAAIGRSRNGTDIRINRLAVEARRIVIISSVEPHYFAGYTGGRKSILPGVAAYETIEQNHKLALRPEARVLTLRGNPVHEDMLDAVAPLKDRIFAINLVLDSGHRAYAACGGAIDASFAAAVDRTDEIFAAPIPQKADVVVSVVKFPLDIDLYQSQKGIDNAKHALKDGGILILVSKCRCGMGEESFARLLRSATSPAGAIKMIEQRYVLGYHKAAKMAEVSLKSEVWAVTGLPAGELGGLFIRSWDSIQNAVDEALKKKGDSAKAVVLLDGGLVVPCVR